MKRPIPPLCIAICAGCLIIALGTAGHTLGDELKKDLNDPKKLKVDPAGRTCPDGHKELIETRIDRRRIGIHSKSPKDYTAEDLAFEAKRSRGKVLGLWREVRIHPPKVIVTCSKCFYRYAKPNERDFPELRGWTLVLKDPAKFKKPFSNQLLPLPAIAVVNPVHYGQTTDAEGKKVLYESIVFSTKAAPEKVLAKVQDWMKGRKMDPAGLKRRVKNALSPHTYFYLDAGLVIHVFEDLAWGGDEIRVIIGLDLRKP